MARNDTVSSGTVCQYSLRHKLDKVPAVTTIDCGPVLGIVAACQACADFYARNC